MYQEITDKWVIEKQKELFYELDPIVESIKHLRTIIQNPVKVCKKSRIESYEHFKKIAKELADYYQKVDNFVAMNMIEED